MIRINKDLKNEIIKIIISNKLLKASEIKEIIFKDLKIEIHRMINTIDSKNTFLSIKKELEDRFGKVDEEMIIYMYEEWFEKLASKLFIKNVRETKNFIELIFDSSIVRKIDMEDLFVKSFSISNMFRFQMRGNNLVIILDTIKYYLVDLLELILSLNLD